MLTPESMGLHGVALVLAGIFLGLSLLHFYWMFGGRVGLAAAIPEVEGQPAFRPSRLATMIVAIGLSLCAVLVLATSGILQVPVSRSVLLWFTRALALVFFLRAMGDFRLVGFFKRIHNSRFARMDTRFYSPLCLAIAIGAAVISLKF